MKIKDIGKVVTGKTPPTSHPEYYGGKYMFVTPNELHGGYSVSSTERTITESGIKTITGSIIDGTSVMVGCIGWDMGNVAMSFEKCATNQQINSITMIKDCVNPYYLYYWLSTKKEYLFSIASVTRTPILSKGVFEEVDIPIPPRDLQDRIVDALLPLDRKIENNNNISADLESIAKLLYDYWFVQFDFPDKNGNPYKSNGGIMVWDNQLKKEIPIGWNVMPLGEIIVESAKSSVQVNEAKEHGDYPFFTSGNAVLSYDDFLVDGFHCFLNTGGNPDIKGYYGKCAYSTDTWCIDAGAMSFLMYYYFRKIINQFEQLFFSGSGLKHLQKDILKKVCIAIPPQELLDEFNKIMEMIWQKKASNYIENTGLERMRNFLLPMLLNGQVKVQAIAV